MGHLGVWVAGSGGHLDGSFDSELGGDAVAEEVGEGGVDLGFEAVFEPLDGEGVVTDYDDGVVVTFDAGALEPGVEDLGWHLQLELSEGVSPEFGKLVMDGFCFRIRYSCSLCDRSLCISRLGQIVHIGRRAIWTSCPHRCGQIVHIGIVIEVGPYFELFEFFVVDGVPEGVVRWLDLGSKFLGDDEAVGAQIFEDPSNGAHAPPGEILLLPVCVGVVAPPSAFAVAVVVAGFYLDDEPVVELLDRDGFVESDSLGQARQHLQRRLIYE